MSAPVPVRIRGVDYPSQKAAGRALGVASSTIYHALENGTVDSVGLGSGRRRNSPCVLNGRKWRSVTDAAEALGVSKAAICQAVRARRKHVTPKRVAP